MNRKWIVTVAREYCSGGSDAAKLLAEKLGVPYIDKSAILPKAQAVVEGMPQWKIPSDSAGFFARLRRSEAEKMVSERLKRAQAIVIKQFADEGPCVIVGRAADHILGTRSDVLTVFFTADYKARVELCCQRNGIRKGEAKRLLAKKDKLRSEYYAIYTSKVWGNEAHYDMHFNLSEVDAETAVSRIIAQLEEMDRE